MRQGRPHHTNEETDCPLCEEKLSTADKRIAEWFRTMKKEFFDMHISCAYRGKEEQERVFKQGKSKARFGQSKHNTELDGLPCSKALDVFQLQNGEAAFEARYFFNINEHSKKLGYAINWGGNFTSIVDCCHFELME